LGFIFIDYQFAAKRMKKRRVNEVDEESDLINVKYTLN